MSAFGFGTQHRGFRVRTDANPHDAHGGYFDRSYKSGESAFRVNGTHKSSRHDRYERFAIMYDRRDDLSDDSGNFAYTIEGSGLYSVDMARLVSLSIANTAYNVNNYNNQLTVNEGGGDVTVTLTNGMYNAETLATHIATVLTSAAGLSGTYSGSYSSDTFKISLSIDAGTFSIDQSNLTFPLDEVAGLDTTQTLSSVGTTIEFPYVVQIVPPAIKFRILELGYEIIVPLDATLGSYSISTAQFPAQYERSLGQKRSVQRITVQILDVRDRILYMQHGGVFAQLEAWQHNV